MAALPDFASTDLDEIVKSLTTDEAILLTAGVGSWHTRAISRLGIPPIKVSDGPNGVRGNHFFMSTPAKCLPCATAMGATWDTNLIQRAGSLMAAEARLKAASVILAPTCNIQRSPLGGRSFESFSEDPHLSGMIAASYINGVQAGGIGTTIKHFVANDKEDDRMGYDSIISERALREIYLMPFMLAQKYASPWAIMTAYNRVNGCHASENKYLLEKLLRREWGFTGTIMSDWFGVYGVDTSINAGLDLEMPGVEKWRTPEYMNRAIISRKITVGTIKERARSVLNLVQKCARAAPEILTGDGQERTIDSKSDQDFMRQIASKAIVLLKNEKKVLPLKPQSLKKIAIVGGNAKARVLSGGGSAALKASYFVSPYNGIVNALSEYKNVEITYCEGARAYLTMPSLDYGLITETGARGWIGTWHRHVDDDSMLPVEEPMEKRVIDETQILISTSAPKGITRRWTLRLRGRLQPRPYDTQFEFGLIAAGRAKLFIDGQLVIDNWTRQRRGEAFFGVGSLEEKGVCQLKANNYHDVLVEFCNVRGPADGDEDELVLESNAGVRLGGAEVQDPDALMDKAIELAQDADAVIAIVGLNADWETESYDRKTLSLPGRTDELVGKVVSVNPCTVVVTQAGSAITMPWVDTVPAIVHAWYLGNATGDAIADVLFGKHNPAGRLPLTFPKAEEDVPAFGHFRSENGKVRYAEDLYVGYKHYQHRNIKPLFPFGYGLSYTTFSYTGLILTKPLVQDGKFQLTVSVTVKNTGSISGSEVVQLYIALPKSSEVTHPPLQLKGFAKINDLLVDQSKTVEISLDNYAVSYWDDRFDAWAVDSGSYTVKVGPNSTDLRLSEVFEVKDRFEWRGL
ncbi:glycoside hydrolase family 3 protein [Amanita thiersii Skay4041]|uniref:beta-glucosidase n=2 Tax=Amanita thiersii TaxID=235537 RepID=A0A2A9NYF4_9AGAR|nr:glycoside hydrolase family 3 protein [Amanita thiersii Skay4041]